MSSTRTHSGCQHYPVTRDEIRSASRRVVECTDETAGMECGELAEQLPAQLWQALTISKMAAWLPLSTSKE